MLNDIVDFCSNALSCFEASKAMRKQKQKQADAFLGPTGCLSQRRTHTRWRRLCSAMNSLRV